MTFTLQNDKEMSLYLDVHALKSKNLFYVKNPNSTNAVFIKEVLMSPRLFNNDFLNSHNYHLDGVFACKRE